MSKNKRKITYTLSVRAWLFRIVAGIIAVLCVGVCVRTYTLTGKFLPTRELLNGHASIRFIDVGQGDATLVMTGTHAVLIDTGTNASADSLVTYLQTYLGKIDYLILTHPHEDHTGSAEKILKTFDVSNVITPDIPGDSYYAQLKELTKQYKNSLLPANPGDTYEAGAIRFTILGPISPDSANLNDASIVVRLEVNGVSLLCSGDAEQTAESAVLAKTSPELLDCDLYQVGHHGSSTSTSLEFYYAISPDICVISCGTGNPYGHPHSTTLSLIELGGSKLYRTDLDGTIVFDITEGGIKRRLW